LSLGRPGNDDTSEDTPPAAAGTHRPAATPARPATAGGIDLQEARRFLERAIARQSFRNDPALADELAQEALVNLHRFLAAGGEPRNLEALLNTLAQRTFINHLRRERARKRVFEATPENAPERADRGPRPDDGADPVDLIEFVTLEHFAATSASCLELARHYFDGLDWERVATRLGLQPATVRQRWSRCRESLFACARTEGSALWALGPAFEEREAR
jgi:RNA polymerase sigma factor (sigma-70 family)